MGGRAAHSLKVLLDLLRFCILGDAIDEEGPFDLGVGVREGGVVGFPSGSSSPKVPEVAGRGWSRVLVLRRDSGSGKRPWGNARSRRKYEATRL